MGKNMKHAMEFVTKYPGWHEFNRHSIPTVRAIKRLAKRGKVKLNSFGQFAHIDYVDPIELNIE